MAFVRLSGALGMQTSILVDNFFIVEYMPYAPENYVKVYLYGLSLACREGDNDNNIEKLSKMLSLEVSTVVEAYTYWANEGLVHMIPTAAYPEIEYLPVKSAADKIKKFKPEKYAGFNKQLEAALPDRNILPNEYHEYYMAMEILHIEQEAMLEIICYCARKKGGSIGYPYILAVARNLAYEGLVSYDKIHERLVESELNDPEILNIFKALKIKRSPDFDDTQLYKKWTTDFCFRIEDIIYAAKKVKSGGMTYLDTMLTKYYDNQILSKTEMQAYDQNKEDMRTLAKKINYFLGLSYQQTDFLVDTYVSNWLSKGFETEAILKVAQTHAKLTHRSWEYLDKELDKLYKKGTLTLNSLNNHYNEMEQADKIIQKILLAAGIERAVTSRDRDSFRIWTYVWGFGIDIIEFAAAQSKNKISPLPYMNTVLASWFEQGIKTLADAQKTAPNAPAPVKQNAEAAAIAAANERKRQAESKADAIYAAALKDENFASIESQIRTLNFELAKNEGDAKLASQLTAANAQRIDALKKLGFDESDLIPKYSCTQCNDTGRKNNAICSCIKNQLNADAQKNASRLMLLQLADNDPK